MAKRLAKRIKVSTEQLIEEQDTTRSVAISARETERVSTNPLTPLMRRALEDNGQYVRIGGSYGLEVYTPPKVRGTPSEIGLKGVPCGSPEADAMVRRVAVSGLVDQWASTSNSNSVRSQSVQMAAQEVFNLDDAAQWNGTSRGLRAEVELRYEKHGETYREFVKAQYDETQAMFKSMGVTEIDVYRGEGGNNLRASGAVIPSGGVADVQTSMRPLSSWASEIQVAQKFAKGDKAVILKATVPVSRVVSTPHSGNGCLNEHEIVLFGGTLSAKAADAATVRVVENGVVSTVKPDVRGIFKAILVVRVDRDDASADWVKTLSWDLPQTVEGMEAFLGSDWREIMEPLPAWLAAPDSLKKITLLKHGTGDQSPHGNWARGGGALDPTNADDVREAFTGTIETRAGTVNVVVDSVDVFDFSTTVQGALIGPGGEYHGRWHRTITPEIKVMYNESFEVAEGSRKSGIGTEFQKHSERAALALGMEKINIKAADDGREAWATERFGFDFAGPPSEGLARTKASANKMNRPATVAKITDLQTRFEGPEDNWPKPHEILALKSDPALRLFMDGKDLGQQILSHGWEGKKPANRVTKQVEPKMFYVTVESDYAPVTKHGTGDQSPHGNWARDGGESDLASGVDVAAIGVGFPSSNAAATAAMASMAPDKVENLVELFTTLRSKGTVLVAAQPADAAALLKDGQFRTVFETGTSQGNTDIGKRERSEETMFGIPKGGRDRPVYGYVALDNLAPEGVEDYGPIRFELKPDVKNRSTMTDGDSLLSAATPLPMTGGTISRFDAVAASLGNRSMSTLYQAFERRDRAVSDEFEAYSRTAYVEAQIKGKLSVSDIVKIHVAYPKPQWNSAAFDAVEQAAAALGIPVIYPVGSAPGRVPDPQPFFKHGTGDQSPHGNWARDVAEGDPHKMRAAWDNLKNGLNPNTENVKAGVSEGIAKRMTSTVDDMLYTVYGRSGSQYAQRDFSRALSVLSTTPRQYRKGFIGVTTTDQGFLDFIPEGKPLIGQRPVAAAWTPEADALVKTAMASELIRDWAVGSNDTTMGMAVQETAKRVFGLTDASEWSRLSARSGIGGGVDDLLQDETSRKVFEDYVTATYEETQSKWKEQGIESVTLYRGINDSRSPKIRDGLEFREKGIMRMPVQMRPLTSWAYTKDGALAFASGRGSSGVIFKAIVPIKNVWSSAVTGAGCVSEDEFIVLGGNIPTVAAEVTTYEDLDHNTFMVSTPWEDVDKAKNRAFNIDASPMDADWIKTLSWDLPTTPEGMEAFLGPDWRSIMKLLPAWLAAPESLKSPAASGMFSFAPGSKPMLKHKTHDQSDHGNWARDTIEPEPQQVRDAWTELSELASPNTFGFEAGKIKAFVAQAVANRMTSSVAEIVEVAYSRDVRLGVRQEEALLNARAALSTASPEVRALSPRISHVTTSTQGRLEWTYGGDPPDGSVRVHTPEADAMIKRAAVSAMIKEWSIGSNDSNLGLAIQDTAKRVFDLPDAAEWNDPYNIEADGVRRLVNGENSKKVLEDYVSATYETTQAMWKKMGIKSVALYRGIDDTRNEFKSQPEMQADEIMRTPVKMRPLTSWAFTETGAKLFAGSFGVIFKAVVPIENVWSTALTGAGCHHEDEFIILGGDIPTVAARVNGRINNDGDYEAHVPWDSVAKAKTASVNIDASPMDADWIKTLSWDLPDTADEMEAFLGPDWRSIMEPLPAWLAAPESLKSGAVAKHGSGDQSPHGNWARGGSGSDVALTGPERVAAAFNGEYQTNTGQQFTLAANDVSGVEGDTITVKGEILVGDQVVGQWIRVVSGTTMYAESLNVGKDFGGNALPGAEKYQGQGIALEVQKQTEKAARNLGCTEIKVSAMNDGVAAWAQERFGYRFERKPELRGNSKPGKEPRTEEELAIPKGGMAYVQGAREYRGEDGLLLGVSHPDLGIPSVRNALAGIEERFKSRDPDDWPTPAEVVSLGTGRRVSDDILQGKTLGEFLLSRGWSGIKSSDHVTKAAAGYMRVVVEGEKGAVEKRGTGDRSPVAVIVKFAPGLNPMLKHKTHDQSDHGNWSRKVNPSPMNTQQIWGYAPSNVKAAHDALYDKDAYEEFIRINDHGGGCEDIAFAVESRFDIPQVFGYHTTKGGVKEYHSWNQSDNGYILDAAQYVFGDGDGSRVAVYEPGNPRFEVNDDADVLKHGTGDQSPHGNWANDGGQSSSTGKNEPRIESWRDVPFDAEDMSDLAYAMEEPDPPKKLYHVAPRTARADIAQYGLDASGKTWNTGASEGWNEGEFNWTESDDGEVFQYEYRPTGVYMFADLVEAGKYNSDGKGDIYEIDTAANDREIIRDPSQASDWEYVDEPDRAYVTRYVEPSAFRIVEEPVAKHGSGDQSPHGNWARDVAEGDPNKMRAAWDNLKNGLNPNTENDAKNVKEGVSAGVAKRMSSTVEEMVYTLYARKENDFDQRLMQRTLDVLSSSPPEKRGGIYIGVTTTDQGFLDFIMQGNPLIGSRPVAAANTPKADAIVKQAMAAEFVRDWALGSNDTTVGLAIQSTAKRLFGLTDASEWAGGGWGQDRKQIDALLQDSTSRKVLEDYVTATYEETQAKWKEQGIKSVTLYRGINDSSKKIRDDPAFSGKGIMRMPVQMRPLTSWAYTKDGALTFASGKGSSGVIFKAIVPIENVWSSAVTGAGCLYEDEFIVLGGNIPTVAAEVINYLVGPDETVTSHARFEDVDKAKKQPFNIDASPMNADWIKTLSWDLPTTPEGMEAFLGPDWLSIMKPLQAWRAAPESLKTPDVATTVSFAPGLKPVLKHGSGDQSPHGNWARGVAEPDPAQVTEAWRALSNTVSTGDTYAKAQKIKAHVAEAVASRMTSPVAEIVEVVYSRNVRLGLKQKKTLINARAALSTASPEVRALSPDLTHVATDAKGRLEWIYSGDFGGNGGDDKGVPVHTPEADAMIKRAAVSAMVKEWSVGANDSNLGLAIQDTAKRVFDLPDASEWNDSGYNIDADAVSRLVNGQTSRKVIEDYLTATYESTQATWKAEGIKSVTLYRGISDTRNEFKSRPEMQADEIMRTPVKMRPLTSWAFTETGARMFSGGSGVIFKAIVPIENVWSTALTGAGCYNEDEFIILGGNIPTVAAQMSFKINSSGGYTPHADWDTVSKAKAVAFNIDASPMDADWIKTLSWDLPETVEEMEEFLGPDWRSVMEPLPAWLAAPESLKSPGSVAATVSFAPGLKPVLKHGTGDQSPHGNWARDVTEPSTELMATAWNKLTHLADSVNGGGTQLLYGGPSLIRARAVKAVSDRMNSTTAEIVDAIYNDDARSGDSVRGRLARAVLSTATAEERATIDGYIAVENGASTGQFRLLTDVSTNVTYGKPYALINTPEADTLIREAAVSEIVHEWAIGSNDSPVSMAIQETAKRVFGLDAAVDWNSRTYWTPETPGKIERLTYGQNNRKVLEDYVTAVYDETQAVWKAEGIKSVTLYRGINDTSKSIRTRPGMLGDTGVKMNVSMRPLSSWAYTPIGAQDFAAPTGVVFKAVVPIENVWSSALTGAGCHSEDEFIIFGGDVPTVAYNQGNAKAVQRMSADIVDKAKAVPFNIDDSPINADWIKTLSWDLPTTPEGMEALLGPNWFSYMKNRPAWRAAPDSLKSGAVAKHGTGDQSPHGNWARDVAEPNFQQVDEAWVELSHTQSPGSAYWNGQQIKAHVAKAVASRMTSPIAEIVEVVYSRDVRTDSRQQEALRNGRAALSTASPEERALSPKLTHVATGFRGSLEWVYDNQPHSGAVPIHTPEADAMIKRAAVSLIIKEWAIGANDSNLGLAIQDTAKRVFDLPDASEWKSPYGITADGVSRLVNGETSRKVIEDYLTATYEETQAVWKAEGIKSVTLYRGINDTKNQFKSQPEMQANGIMRTPVKMRPLTSWAYTEKGAQMFSGDNGVVFKAVVPIENVWSTALTGAGCHNEDEFIILGGDIPTVAAQMAFKINSSGGYTPHADWDTVGKAKAVAFNIDASPMDADWIKTLSWDLPETVEGMEELLGPDWLSIMKPLPAWLAAPESLKSPAVAGMVSFAPGLKPVLKHGTGDQSPHGNWARDVTEGDPVRVEEAWRDLTTVAAEEAPEWADHKKIKAHVAQAVANRMTSSVRDIVDVAFSTDVRSGTTLGKISRAALTTATPEERARGLTAVGETTHGALEFWYGDKSRIPGGFVAANTPEADAMVRRAAVSMMVQEWATGSNDTNLALAVQETAKRVFDLPDASNWKSGYGIESEPIQRLLNGKTSRKVLEDYVTATYEETQAVWKAKGIESVTVYRGINDSMERMRNTPEMKSDSIMRTDVRMRPLTSWAYTEQEALTFASGWGSSGVLFKAVVPIENVWSTAVTGAGCWDEDEFIILGGKIPTVAAEVFRGMDEDTHLNTVIHEPWDNVNKAKTEPVNIDDTSMNADWIKTLSWDLPTTPEEMEEFLGPDWLSIMKPLPAWLAAPESLKSPAVAGMVSFAPGLKPVLKHGTGDQSPHGNWARDVTEPPRSQVFEAWGKLTRNIDPDEEGAGESFASGSVIKAHVVKAVSGRMTSTTEELIDAVYNDDFTPYGNKFRERARGALSTASLEERAAIYGNPAIEVEDRGIVVLLSEPMMQSHIKYGRPFARVNTPEADTLIREGAVSEIVAQWAAGSNSTPASLAVQETAKRVFGLDGAADWNSRAHWSASTPGRVERLTYGQNSRKVLEDYVEAVYEETQAVWKKEGIESVTLYRGIHDTSKSIRTRPGMMGDTGVKMDVTMRPFTSWAYSISGAVAFAQDRGVIFKAVVPIENVWSTALTGAGCHFEDEFIILGGTIPTVAYNQGNTKAVESMFFDDEEVDKARGAVAKHGTGDQSPHGNWASGGGGKVKAFAAEQMNGPKGAASGPEKYVTHEEYKQRVESHGADLGWVDNRGSGQNVASSLKASVSQRLADRMDVPTAELISACFPETTISGSADRDVTYQEWQQALTQKEGQRVYLEAGRIYVFQSRRKGDDPKNVFGAPPSVPTGFGEAEALVREAAVSNLVNAWSETSNDTSVKSLSVQRAAEDVFQIKDATPWSKSEANSEEFRARLDTHYEKHKETFQQFVRAQYDETQAMFKDIGVTEMDIYRGEGGATFRKRGVDVPSGSSVEVTTAMRPLSSWASDFDTAQSFATSDTAVILKTRIPVSRIVATPWTGNGCKNENEIVLMGGPVTSQVAGLDTPTLRSKKAQEGLFKAALVVQIDEDDDSADWIKTLSWDLPTTPEGMEAFLGPDWLSIIEPLPAWRAAPESLKSPAVVAATVSFAPGLKPVLKHGTGDQSPHGNWARDVTATPTERLFEAWKGLTLEADPYWNGPPNLHGGPGAIKAHVVKAVSARMSSTTAEIVDAVYNNDFRPGGSVRGEQARGALSTATAEERAAIDGYSAVEKGEVNGKFRLVTPIEMVSRIKYGQPFALINTPEADTLIRDSALSEIVAEWAAGSNGTPAGFAVQTTAKRVFGLDESADWQWAQIDGVIVSGVDPGKIERLTYGQNNRKVLEDYVEATYEETQAVWKKQGIKSVTLYRGIRDSNYSIRTRPGMSGDAGVNMDVTMRPLTSWAYTSAGARFFAGSSGVIFKAVVPIEKVWSTALTGAGCYFEDEFIILGGTIPTVAYNLGNTKAVESMINDDETVDKATKGDPFNIDENPMDADWIKTLSWDLPTTPEGMEAFFGPDWLSIMKPLPAWLAAPESLKSPAASGMISFAPGLKPVLKHGSGDQSPHGNWAHGGEKTSSPVGGTVTVTTAVDGYLGESTDGKGNLLSPIRIKDSDYPDEEITVVPFRAGIEPWFKGDPEPDGINTLTISKDGEEAGVMRYSPYSGKVEWVNVEEKFQRQGVATRLWGAAKYLSGKYPNMVEPKHSDKQSNEGSAWASVVKFYRSIEVNDGMSKHGIGDQSPHGNWAHGEGTGSHAGEAKLGPASASDGYGNARGTAAGGFYEATEQELADYRRASGNAKGPVKLYVGPNGTGVTVMEPIKSKSRYTVGLTPEDIQANLEMIGELQRISPAPGLQVIVEGAKFERENLPTSTLGFVDTRDMDTIYLRPEAFMGDIQTSSMMQVGDSVENKRRYSVVHEYGHVVDRRSDEKSLDDFNEVINGQRGLVTGSSRYAREGAFGEGAGLKSSKPTGREMFAEAWTGWVMSKGWSAKKPGMVQFFAEKYGWDTKTGTAPMAKAKGRGRIYVDTFGPEGGYVLDSLPGESPTVAKHGIHDQLRHGNWAHGKGTGSHAGEAKIGPASATDGYGNARGTTYVSGNRGETQTPLPEGWFRATEKEHDDYDRANMRSMLPSHLSDGLEAGSAREDNYLRSYKSTTASKVQLFAGPNGTGVVVQGQISWRDDFTPDDLVQNLKQLGGLQRVTPAPGLQVFVGTQAFRKFQLDDGCKGFVDTRDNDTIYLRPSALSAGDKYDVTRSWDRVMQVPATDRPSYALTHEYGHVVDRRSDEVALADFYEVVHSDQSLVTGSSAYSREGYFGEGVGGLQVGDKPTGREMYAEAWTGWVLSKGWKAKKPGMVKHFAEKYGWDSKTGTAPMAKAKGRGRIYVDTFGPKGGYVLDSLPGESPTIPFTPWQRPVLKHDAHNQKDHGRRYSGEVDAAVAEKAIRLVGEYGGLSIKMTDGSEPPDGYMVARKSSKFGIAVTADEFYGPRGAEHLATMVLKNRIILGSGRAYLGVWHQTEITNEDGSKTPLAREDQVVHLDVTDRIIERSQAVSLGRRRDQISIWDVINTEEIQTGGKGADVEKHYRRSNPEATVEDDGRRRPGVGEAVPRAVGQAGRPAVAVVGFAPGLKPLLKHGTGDQSPHGNWARGRAGKFTSITPEEGAANIMELTTAIDVWDDNYGTHINKYADGSAGSRRKGEVAEMRYIMNARGSDLKPEQVDPARMDELIEQGGVEVFRGSSEANHQRVRDGEKKFQTGLWGTGLYTTTDERIGNKYTVSDKGKGSVLRMVLKPGAKVAVLDDQGPRNGISGGSVGGPMAKVIWPAVDAAIAAVSVRRPATRRDMYGPENPPPRSGEIMGMMLHDIGLAGAFAGYDAVKIPFRGEDLDEDWYLILDPAKTAVERVPSVESE